MYPSNKTSFACFCFFLWFISFSFPFFGQIDCVENILLVSPAHAYQPSDKTEKGMGKAATETMVPHGNTMPEDSGSMSGQAGGMMKKLIESGKLPDSFRPQLYPSMVELFDPSKKSFDAFEQHSLMRISRGYELLSESMKKLPAAITSRDFMEIRNAHEQLRTGYEQLRSGISTYLKLANGESPREIGFNWFKQELNIDYSSPFYHREILWGMDVKRLIICIIMLSGFALVIIAYMYRIHRVKALFQKISDEISEPLPSKPFTPRTTSPKSISPKTAPPRGDNIDDKVPIKSGASTTAEPVLEVNFSESGKHAALPTGTTVLEAAESVGVEIDNSCREGFCGLCKIKLLKGQVSMECDEALTEEDKKDNMILACQAKADDNITVKA